MNDMRIDPLLSGYGVVYFGNDLMSENRTSSHHMAFRLAERLPVLYIDSPGLRPPRASGRDLKRVRQKLREAMRLPRRVRPNLWHATIPQIPFRSWPGVDALNRMYTKWAVRRALKHVQFEKRISWFVAPHPGFMAGHLGEDLCVHYCTDDHSSHPGVNSVQVARAEEQIARKADIVFVAPPSLVEKKRSQNPNTHFAPHGVDVEMFARAMDPSTPVAPVAAELPKPVVGYFGTVGAWIDTEMIQWIAEQRPDWSFVLVGQAFVDTSRLKALPNVRVVGVQPYETLPNWARAFDVAIIPYLQNDQTRNANPLKLREYLATGRPVVAAWNPEVIKFSDIVRVAGDRQSFMDAIADALQNDNEQARQRRLAAVADSTWDNRFSDVLTRVRERLQDKVAAGRAD